MNEKKYKNYRDENYFAKCYSSKDSFPIIEFTIENELFNYYSIELTIISDNLISEKNLNDNFTIKILKEEKNKTKEFKGILTSFELISQNNEEYIYKLFLNSDLWKLSLDNQFNIYQDETKFEIIKDILKNYNIKFQNYCKSNENKQETNTQFQETTLNYLIRLIQEEEILFFYDFNKNQYSLIENKESNFKSQLLIPKQISQNYNFEEIISYKIKNNSVLNNFESIGYDYNKSEKKIFKKKENPNEIFSKKYKYSQYENQISDNENSNEIREIYSKEEIELETTSLESQAGCWIEIKNEVNPKIKYKKYLITKQTITLKKNDNKWEYKNILKGVNDYKIQKTKFKPIINNIQTGIVIGNSINKDINVDSLGRIKVKFHWMNQKNSTAWIRVMQWGVAGSNYGNSVYPRVGEEVVVSFLNGDIDKPIVLGTVYNSKNENPLNLTTSSADFIMKHKAIMTALSYAELAKEEAKKAAMKSVINSKTNNLLPNKKNDSLINTSNPLNFLNPSNLLSKNNLSNNLLPNSGLLSNLTTNNLLSNNNLNTAQNLFNPSSLSENPLKTAEQSHANLNNIQNKNGKSLFEKLINALPPGPLKTAASSFLLGGGLILFTELCSIIFGNLFDASMFTDISSLIANKKIEDLSKNFQNLSADALSTSVKIADNLKMFALNNSGLLLNQANLLAEKSKSILDANAIKSALNSTIFESLQDLSILKESLGKVLNNNFSSLNFELFNNFNSFLGPGLLSGNNLTSLMNNLTESEQKERFNEISINNSAYLEEIKLRSQKNIKLIALNDITNEIDNNYILNIKGNRYESFGTTHGNSKLQEMTSLAEDLGLTDGLGQFDLYTMNMGTKIVKINEGAIFYSVSMGKISFSTTLGPISLAALALSFTATNLAESISSNKTSNVGGNFSTNVGGNYILSVKGAKNIDVLGIFSTSINGKYNFNCVGQSNIQSTSLNLNADANLNIQSNGIMTIKANVLNIEAIALNIKATSLKIDAQAMFNLTAGAVVQIKGAIIQLG